MRLRTQGKLNSTKVGQVEKSREILLVYKAHLKMIHKISSVDNAVQQRENPVQIRLYI